MSRGSWRTTCQAEWESVRSDLEVRQVPEQEERCDRASAALDDVTCDELRILYLGG